MSVLREASGMWEQMGCQNGTTCFHPREALGEHAGADGGCQKGTFYVYQQEDFRWVYGNRQGLSE